jgi:propionyl-CoA carboxylase alpha chain
MAANANMPITKILIANRGEIAIRIIKTCRRMGIATLAVYSEADLRAPHVRLADEAACIGPAPARQSYLDGGRLIEAAVAHGCQAVHPGYGFLSENADFARAVLAAGLVYIGPTPEAIATLGDKMAAKALAVAAGVPVVPGHDRPLADADEALAVAEALGWPVLLKPAAGGGGRGMRIVREPAEMASALAACRQEALKGFADDRIFLERYVDDPRHVEVQVMADRHGNVIHLGERECSIQRRYQKVIEETPSPAVDEGLRAQMGEVACALARASGYQGAGTVEFILAPDGSFFFLEMNTRLQVEHPITEMVTGLDLVELMIRGAAGEPLPLTQQDVRLNGWAIEARVCAEDPNRGFVPTTGMITRYAVPRGEGVRLDSGIEAGSVISIHYDSLLAKVAAWGEDRERARQRLIKALNGYHIEGLTTNVDFVNAVANHPAFAAGRLSTGFIDEHFPDGQSTLPPDPELLRYVAMAAVLVFHTRRSLVKQSLKPMSPLVGQTPNARDLHDYVVRVDGMIFELSLKGQRGSRAWEVTVDGQPHEVQTPEFAYFRRRLAIKIDGFSHMFRLQYFQNHIKGFFCGEVRTFEIYTPAEWALAQHMPRRRKEVADNALRCPMPGLITAVYVKEGDYVRKDQELVRMESMKMESGIASPRDAQVEKVMAVPGQTVESGETLITFKLK